MKYGLRYKTRDPGFQCMHTHTHTHASVPMPAWFYRTERGGGGWRPHRRGPAHTQDGPHNQSQPRRISVIVRVWCTLSVAWVQCIKHVDQPYRAHYNVYMHRYLQSMFNAHARTHTHSHPLIYTQTSIHQIDIHTHIHTYMHAHNTHKGHARLHNRSYLVRCLQCVRCDLLLLRHLDHVSLECLGGEGVRRGFIVAAVVRVQHVVQPFLVVR